MIVETDVGKEKADRTKVTSIGYAIDVPGESLEETFYESGKESVFIVDPHDDAKFGQCPILMSPTHIPLLSPQRRETC